MLRCWMLGGLCGLLLASVCRAEPGVVKTRDGQTFTGDVIEHEDDVVVVRKGIRTTIPRAQIRSVSLSNSVEQEYTRRLAKLNAYDVRGRIELAQWVFQNKAYALALEVLGDAQKLQPRNEEVQDMIRVVHGQMYLEEREARKHAPVQLASREADPRNTSAAAAPPPPTAPSTAPTSRPTTQRATRVVTPDEINLVRQSEWREGQRMGATFKNDVRRTFVVQQNINPTEFNRGTPAQQAWVILQNGTPDNKKNVILSNDPASLNTFRTIQLSLLSACAACHTADKHGGSFVLRWPATSDADRYTNFVILQKYTQKVGDRVYSMIDRDRPQDSLLLQFALPSGVGSPSHPVVKEYRGVVKTLGDTRAVRTGEWISSLNNPAPDYSSIDLSGAPDATRTPAAPGK